MTPKIRPLLALALCSVTNCSSLAAKYPARTLRSTSSVTLATVADATLREAYPSSNYGDWDSLEFIAPSSAGGLSNKVESVVQFDLSELNAANDPLRRADIKSAHLKLFTTRSCNFQHILNSEHIGLLAIGLAEDGREWAESEVNWSNSPQLLEGGGTMVIPLGSLSSWKEIDIGAFFPFFYFAFLEKAASQAF